MKENYVTPEVDLIGFASEQPNAAVNFDDFLIPGAEKREIDEISGVSVPVKVREYY